MRNPLSNDAPDHIVQLTISLILVAVLIVIIVAAVINPFYGSILLTGLILLMVLIAAIGVLHYMLSK